MVQQIADDPTGAAGPARRMPPRAPLMLRRTPLAAARRPLRAAPPPRARQRAGLALLAVGLAAGPVWAMLAALPAVWGLGEAALFALFLPAAGWTALAAAVAMLGVLPLRPAAPPGRDWRPRGRTAIAILVCGEPPLPLAARVRALHRDLAAAGLGAHTEIHVLSDTAGAAARAEARALAALAALPGVWWRQRARNAGRKPGNLADWLAGWGGRAEHVVVLDADSRMSAARIARLIHRMEAAPGVGLIQSGLRLVPARTRLGALQRLSARLCGPAFGRGLAAWAGSEGNSWGHNLILRTAAFAEVARLPVLSGRPPFGGPVLSHDFIEAAFLRRVGWAVEIDPDGRGSFEDAPQRLEPFHRRDRRWCQGNLQHLRLVAARGLHGASRVHLASGIFGYLAAPVWLGLVLTVALGRPDVATAWPMAGALALLLLPKAAGAGLWLARARTPARRRVICRAAVAELALSTLIAPVLLLRQSLAVAAVLAGRDCGWVPAGGPGAARGAARPGRLEQGAGLGLLALVAPGASAAQLALLVPMLGPLLAAPWLVRWFERPTRRPASGLTLAPRRRRPAATQRAAA